MFVFVCHSYSVFVPKESFTHTLSLSAKKEMCFTLKPLSEGLQAHLEMPAVVSDPERERGLSRPVISRILPPKERCYV